MLNLSRASARVIGMTGAGSVSIVQVERCDRTVVRTALARAERHEPARDRITSARAPNLPSRPRRRKHDLSVGARQQSVALALCLAVGNDALTVEGHGLRVATFGWR